jgi:hypothetical protein
MFSKCANPDCTYTFDFRFGRVMRFHNNENPERAGVTCLPCVRHFWLCERCSRTHVLEHQPGVGLVIRERLGDLIANSAPRPVCDCPIGRRSVCHPG